MAAGRRSQGRREELRRGAEAVAGVLPGGGRPRLRRASRGRISTRRAAAFRSRDRRRTRATRRRWSAAERRCSRSASASQALEEFEAAVAADPALTGSQGRIEVLRFRGSAGRCGRARKAAEAGRVRRGARLYDQALAARPTARSCIASWPPSSAGRATSTPRSSTRRRRRRSIPTDARSLVLIGGYLRSAQRSRRARRPTTRRSRSSRTSRLERKARERARERLALAALPAEYRAIESAPPITRGASRGARRRPARRSVQARRPAQRRGHHRHAQQLGGALDHVGRPRRRHGAVPNHTFQPRRAVRRIDLAQAVSRLLSLIAAEKPAVGASWRSASAQFTDLSPAHLATRRRRRRSRPA